MPFLRNTRAIHPAPDAKGLKDKVDGFVNAHPEVALHFHDFGVSGTAASRAQADTLPVGRDMIICPD
jgi:hypothetical protein